MSLLSATYRTRCQISSVSLTYGRCRRPAEGGGGGGYDADSETTRGGT